VEFVVAFVAVQLQVVTGFAIDLVIARVPIEVYIASEAPVDLILALITGQFTIITLIALYKVIASAA
jgi:hypothetical protein